jgi:Ca2+-binding EF-hand superfamily protein
MVDKHEFLVGAADYQKVATNENIKRAFSLFDVDKDGQIDISEFKYVFPQDDTKTVADQTDEARWVYLME